MMLAKKNTLLEEDASEGVAIEESVKAAIFELGELYFRSDRLPFNAGLFPQYIS
jgi:hypothetical protein